MFNKVGDILLICNVHDNLNIKNIKMICLMSESLCLINKQLYEYFYQSGSTLRIQNYTFGNLFLICDKISVRKLILHWKQLGATKNKQHGVIHIT